MRLHMILPRVDANIFVLPAACPHPDCTSTHFQRHQTVAKPLVDTHYAQVSAQRYRCLGCGRTFRVYPQGVDRHSLSQRTRGLGVMLYLLGLSYGATSLALGALGAYQAKSTVYEAVQEVAERVPGLTRKCPAVRCTHPRPGRGRDGREVPRAVAAPGPDGG